MKFTPSDDYAELRTQARALATLADSLQKQLDHVSNDAAELRRKLALMGDDAVRAERATNEQLTAAFEFAEAREAELRAEVERLRAMVTVEKVEAFVIVEMMQKALQHSPGYYFPISKQILEKLKAVALPQETPADPVAEPLPESPHDSAQPQDR